MDYPFPNSKYRNIIYHQTQYLAVLVHYECGNGFHSHTRNYECGNEIQYHTRNQHLLYITNGVLSNCTTPGKRYWKILRVVMVITSESIEIITSGRRPRVINSILSQVITITTSNIFQYLLSPEWCNNIP